MFSGWNVAASSWKQAFLAHNVRPIDIVDCHLDDMFRATAQFEEAVQFSCLDSILSDECM